MMRATAMCFGMLVAMCPAAEAQQGAVGLRDAPEQLRATSEIKGLTFTLLDKLPRSTAAKRVPDFCTTYVAPPKTSGGRTARAFGWTVTGEAPLGPLTAVSFAAGFEAATSGTCFVQGGNIGIFSSEGALIALAYAPRGSKLSIGKVTSLESGAVRVWDGEPPGSPIADLERHNGGHLLTLAGLAAQETQCGGRATIPNIYGKPINEARKLLWARGWAPIPTQPPAQRGTREAELAGRGMTEVDGCSGTGFGYCNYNYRGGAGTLSVTTIGEDDYPPVSGYGTTCQ